MNYPHYNTRVKCYPDGQRKVTIANREVFKHPDDLSTAQMLDGDELISKPKDMKTESRHDSICRAKNRIYDILQMNEDLTWFVTLTFDPKKHNSSDKNAVSKNLRIFLSNAVQRNGLKYLFIAEYHKSGCIHFHGFINDSLNLVLSDTVIAPNHSNPIKIETAKKYGIPIGECKPVYNLPSWAERYGWTTVLKMTGERAYVAKYVTKYITKDCKKILGHFYLAGGHGLVRDVPYFVATIDNPMSVKAQHSSYCEPIDTWFKYLDSTNVEDEKELDILGL